jgi:hypothetical protein
MKEQAFIYKKNCCVVQGKSVRVLVVCIGQGVGVQTGRIVLFSCIVVWGGELSTLSVLSTSLSVAGIYSCVCMVRCCSCLTFSLLYSCVTVLLCFFIAEFYEEALSLVYDLTSKTISPDMWKVLELIYQVSVYIFCNIPLTVMCELSGFQEKSSSLNWD